MDRMEENGYIKKCIQCGTSLSHLRETKRAGCSHCYNIFCEEIDRLTGESFPSGEEDRGDGLYRMNFLMDRLQEALRREDYEQAARIRDELAGKTGDELPKGK